MTVVFTSIRKADKWYVRGHSLVGDCDSVKTPPVWSGDASLNYLADIFTFVRPYVTKSLWDSATDEVKNIIKGRIAGVVGPDYIRWELREGRWWCSFFNPDSIIPVKVCTEGEKRNPKTCWDGTTIHGEVCRNNAWVPSGETCPPKPECKEGDKKAGYICEGGKWVPYTPPVVPPVEPPVTPPVVPPVAPPKYLTPEEAAERIRAGLPCYIKCTLPILDLLPGIPYTPGMWVPPFCAITTKP